MLRQLLTVLALFTGLAAVAEPAHAARVASVIESTSRAEQGVDCASKRVPLVFHARVSGARSASDGARAWSGDPVTVLTIQLQADRARE